MKETFEFRHLKKDINSCGWIIEVEWHDDYRDFVILKQKDCNNGKMVRVIMLNPGRFKDDKDKIWSDSTLRHIREAFENSGYILKIFNLFNLSQPSQKKFYETPNEIKKDNNPLDDELKNQQKEGIVVLQWGEIKDNYTKNRRDEILSHIEKLGLKKTGLKNKDGSYYSHPSHWKPDKIKEFREKILPEIDKQLK